MIFTAQNKWEVPEKTFRPKKEEVTEWRKIIMKSFTVCAPHIKATHSSH
jgi:hypothetical protein